MDGGQEWQRSQAAEMNGLSPVNVSMWPHRAGVVVYEFNVPVWMWLAPGPPHENAFCQGGVVVDPSADRNSNFFCLSKTKRHCLQ